MFVNVDNVQLYNIMLKKIRYYYNTKHLFTLANKKGKVIDLPISIDIETTTTGDFCFPYIYMFGIDGICYATRYKNTFLEIMRFLCDISLEYDVTQIIFIHNLNYELTFFSGYFSDFDKFSVFATEKNKALCVRLGNIQILDTLRLCNMSLEKMAINYNLPHKKMKGNLDYSIYRDCTSYLSYVEKEYCSNDVIILNEYWSVYKKFALTKKQLFRIIMTSTGITRLEIQKHVKNRKKTQQLIWKANDYSKEPEIEKLIKDSYVGAFVKSNRNLTKKILYDIDMYDETSAYIGVLFEYKYPMYKYKKVDVKDIKEITSNINDNSYIFKIRFYNVKVKLGFSTLSNHKLSYSINTMLDNGRVFSSSCIELTITETDYIDICNFYTFSKYEILECIYSKKEYLPKYLLDTAIELFKEKQELKHDKKRDEQMYLLKKGILNALYGCCVEKEHLLEYVYDIETGCYTVEKNDKKKTKGYLLRSWGTYITAYARHNLLYTINCIEKYKKDSVIYTDTDSIKVLECDDIIRQMIHDINTELHNMIKQTCLDLDYNVDDLEDIGLWDYEGKADKFITNGSKKYAYSKNGKVNVAISGINKTNFIKYCTIKSLDIFDVFQMEKFIVPSKYTNKLACNYVILDDFYTVANNTNEIHGYVYLKPVDFTFKIDDVYDKLLKILQNCEIMESDII